MIPRLTAGVRQGVVLDGLSLLYRLLAGIQIASWQWSIIGGSVLTGNSFDARLYESLARVEAYADCWPGRKARSQVCACKNLIAQHECRDASNQSVQSVL